MSRTAHISALVVILALVTWIGWYWNENQARAWLFILILLTAFAVIAGHGITGLWRGVLIDARNKMSLSRLQFAAWTLIVLSAILAAGMTNLGQGWEASLDINIPPELWVLMGISTASLVGAPAVLSNKAARKPKEEKMTQSVATLEAQGYKKLDTKDRTLVVSNTDPSQARWADLMKGEEWGNAAFLDLGKMQMFFFTFILVLVYGTAIFRLFAGLEGPITELPPIQEGMNVLLGISHTGYLSNKAIPHTREAGQ